MGEAEAAALAVGRRLAAVVAASSSSTFPCWLLDLPSSQ